MSDFLWKAIGMLGTAILGGIAFTSCCSFLNHRMTGSTGLLALIGAWVWTWLWTRPFAR